MDVGNETKDEYKSIEDNNTECVRKQGLLRMEKKTWDNRVVRI